MKLPLPFSFYWLSLLLGLKPYPAQAMDYTPPAVIPSHLRETIDKEQSEHDPMPKAHHHKKRLSHQEVTATVTGDDGKEVRIDIKQDGTLAGSTDTQESARTGHSTKMLALTNTATGLLTALIGAGVTLAVKYGDCKKD